MTFYSTLNQLLKSIIGSTNNAWNKKAMPLDNFVIIIDKISQIPGKGLIVTT